MRSEILRQSCATAFETLFERSCRFLSQIVEADPDHGVAHTSVDFRTAESSVSV